MPPATLNVQGRTITAQALTPKAFAPFGSVIQGLGDTAPFTKENAGTARVYADVARPKDTIHTAPSQKPGQPTVRIFVCEPRVPTPSSEGTSYALTQIERHPFTTQIFVPIGLSPASARQTAYMVVVAPTINDLPDLERVEAFFVHGGQGLMYGLATWHAPMMAIGNEVTFVVSQVSNAVDEENVQLIDLVSQSGLQIQVPQHLFDRQSL